MALPVLLMSPNGRHNMGLFNQLREEHQYAMADHYLRSQGVVPAGGNLSAAIEMFSNNDALTQQMMSGIPQGMGTDKTGRFEDYDFGIVPQPPAPTPPVGQVNIGQVSDPVTPQPSPTPPPAPAPDTGTTSASNMADMPIAEPYTGTSAPVEVPIPDLVGGLHYDEDHERSLLMMAGVPLVGAGALAARDLIRQMRSHGVPDVQIIGELQHMDFSRASDTIGSPQAATTRGPHPLQRALPPGQPSAAEAPKTAAPEAPVEDDFVQKKDPAKQALGQQPTGKTMKRGNMARALGVLK